MEHVCLRADVFSASDEHLVTVRREEDEEVAAARAVRRRARRTLPVLAVRLDALPVRARTLVFTWAIDRECARGARGGRSRRWPDVERQRHQERRVCHFLRFVRARTVLLAVKAHVVTEATASASASATIAVVGRPQPMVRSDDRLLRVRRCWRRGGGGGGGEPPRNVFRMRLSPPPPPRRTHARTTTTLTLDELLAATRLSLHRYAQQGGPHLCRESSVRGGDVRGLRQLERRLHEAVARRQAREVEVGVVPRGFADAGRAYMRAQRRLDRHARSWGHDLLSSLLARASAQGWRTGGGGCSATPSCSVAMTVTVRGRRRESSERADDDDDVIAQAATFHLERAVMDTRARWRFARAAEEEDVVIELPRARDDECARYRCLGQLGIGAHYTYVAARGGGRDGSRGECGIGSRSLLRYDRRVQQWALCAATSDHASPAPLVLSNVCSKVTARQHRSLLAALARGGQGAAETYRMTLKGHGGVAVAQKARLRIVAPSVVTEPVGAVAKKTRTAAATALLPAETLSVRATARFNAVAQDRSGRAARALYTLADRVLATSSRLVEDRDAHDEPADENDARRENGDEAE